jgi:NTE family protein
VVMRPRLNGVSSADFSTRKKSIQAGRDAATALLVDLKARIAAKTH